jgi:hypothetical protein
VLSLPVAVKLWYCPDPVDMCLGFDGLFALVRILHSAQPSWHLLEEIHFTLSQNGHRKHHI